MGYGALIIHIMLLQSRVKINSVKKHLYFMYFKWAEATLFSLLVFFSDFGRSTVISGIYVNGLSHDSLVCRGLGPSSERW